MNASKQNNEVLIKKECTVNIYAFKRGHSNNISKNLQDFLHFPQHFYAYNQLSFQVSTFGTCYFEKSINSATSFNRENEK